MSGDITTSYSYDVLPASLQTYCSASKSSCPYDDVTITYNPCSPTISVPSQLFTLNPEWKTCVQGVNAFFDPPYVLTQGGSLTAFFEAANPTPSPSAQPLTTADAPTPTPTNSPDPSPTPDPSPSPDPSPQEPTSSPSSSASPDPLPSPDPSPQDPTSPLNPSALPDPSPIQEPSPSLNPSVSPIEDPTASERQPQSTPATSSVDPNSRKPPQEQSQANPATSPVDLNSPTTLEGQTQTTLGTSLVDPNNSAPTPTTATMPFITGTLTLTPGSPAGTISGTTYSIPASGGIVIINSSITQAISPPGSPSSEPILTYVLGSQTLIAGNATITICSPMVLSLLSGGQSVVIEENGTTKTLAVTAAGVLATATSTELGGIIANVGGFTTPTSTSASTSVAGNGSAGSTGITFQGTGPRIKVVESFGVWIIRAGVVMLGILVM